jgi:hypothetical protein
MPNPAIKRTRNFTRFSRHLDLTEGGVQWREPSSPLSRRSRAGYIASWKLLEGLGFTRNKIRRGGHRNTGLDVYEYERHLQPSSAF